jgi:acylphosphatase
MSSARAKVIIKGRVQGVFYRQSTCTKSLEMEVTGWVRNMPNGYVEAVFEGCEQKIMDILEWCKQGPDSARVDEVIVSYEEPTGEFSTFKIK